MSSTPRHWSYDPAAHRARHIVEMRNPRLWALVVAIVASAYVLLWLTAAVSRAVAQDGSV